MADNVIQNKCESMRRCLERIHEDFNSSKQFQNDLTRQDAIVLNLQRLAQTAIDIATHIVRIKKLGTPQSTRDVFVFLKEAKILTEKTSINMQKMVGFRNTAVHDYQKLNLNIVESIINKHLTDFNDFMKEVNK